MAYFELEDEDKFWSIELAGAAIVRRWGRIGNEGRILERHLGSRLAARAHYKKMIVDKRIDGYVQTAADPDPEDLEPRHRELEAMLVERFDPEAALILGDWLQAQGHPRGELIAVQQAGLEDASRAILERAPELTGELGDVPELAQLGWSSGFVRRATIGSRLPPRRVRHLLDEKFPELKSYEVIEILVDALLALPSARLLETLVIASVGGGVLSSVMRRLSERAPPSLAALEVLDTPRLRSATDGLAEGGLTMFESTGQTIASLRSLRIEPPLHPDQLRRLFRGDWRLESLHLDASGMGDDRWVTADLGRVFALRTSRNLRSLGLINGELPRALLERLLDSRLAEQLEHLDLSGSRISDDDASWLVDQRSRLPRLVELKGSLGGGDSS